MILTMHPTTEDLRYIELHPDLEKSYRPKIFIAEDAIALAQPCYDEDGKYVCTEVVPKDSGYNSFLVEEDVVSLLKEQKSHNKAESTSGSEEKGVKFFRFYDMPNIDVEDHNAIWMCITNRLLEDVHKRCDEPTHLYCEKCPNLSKNAILLKKEE